MAFRQQFGKKQPNPIVAISIIGMDENRVNSTDPVVRYVNASRRETYVGPHGLPNGGFCVSEDTK